MSSLGLAGALALVALASLAVASASTGHSNNWAVLVCTSRYWFNYRHIANVLSIYHTVKQMGIPDSQILLMLPDDMACNPRNSFPAQMFNDRSRAINLYSSEVEVDYRGTEVSVENFVRVLTGRHAAAVPRSKRLLTDAGSNVLVYLTGHGGDEFLKFQDSEEISAMDFADAISQMHIQSRFHELLLMVDTCQAATLHTRIAEWGIPGVIAIGSSRRGENSYSLTHNDDVGVSVIDRFTYYTLNFFQRNRNAGSEPTVQQLFLSYEYSFLHSHAEWVTSAARPLDRVPVSDFFGAVSDVILTAPATTAALPAPAAAATATSAQRNRTLTLIAPHTTASNPLQRIALRAGGSDGGDDDDTADSPFAAAAAAPSAPSSPSAGERRTRFALALTGLLTALVFCMAFDRLILRPKAVARA